jgi:Protein of unknown function (DUF1524)
VPGREELAIKAAFDRLTKYVENVVSEIENSDTISVDKKVETISHKLKSLREKVLDLQLIFVEVGDKDDATTIFVTLNSRGKDLDAGDLVKAHLLQMLPKKGGLDRPREKWDSILAKFDETPSPLSVTEFILAMWRSRYGNTTERTIHKDVRREIKAKNAKGFLDEIVHDAELFRVISDVEYRKWRREANECKGSLRFFHNFGVRQPMPLLLSLLREFDAKHIKMRQMIRALRAIENYHFAWTILSQKTSSGGMSGFFAKKARLLKAANTAQVNAKVVDDLVEELSKKRPDPVEFDAAFSSLWFTTKKSDDKKIIQYILERMHKQAKPNSASSFDQMTIEHLDPQENDAAHVGKLGNLVYVSEALNGQLGNKAWSAKKTILANATEWIPDDVKKAAQIDDAFIQKRTADLAVLARTKVWSGP